jgi:hypothetical protein
MEENQQSITSSQPVKEEPPIESVSLEPEIPERKGKFLKILLYILSALFFLILGASGFWFYQKKMVGELTPSPSPAPSPSPTLNETADWQTYTNTKYGYSIKHPSTMNIDRVESLISVSNEPYQEIISRLESEWWGGTSQSPNKAEDIVVAGVNAKKISGTQVSTGYGLFEAIFPKRDQTYRISFYIGPEEMKLDYGEDTFNLILSTFKFLGEGYSEGWLVYHHDGIPSFELFGKGFRLYYPPSWQYSVKEFEDPEGFILTLKKNGSEFSISQVAGGGGNCLFPGDPPREGMFGRYGEYKEFIKPGEIIWRRAKPENSDQYVVCQRRPDKDFFTSATDVGVILSFAEDSITLTEIDQMLERLEISN